MTLSEDAWAGFETGLRAYVRSRVDPLWVDDVIGDILLRLVQHQNSLESAEKPVAWMHRVATNAITDHYRRRAVEKMAIAQVAQEGDEDIPSASHEDTSATADLACCLVPFIKTLPQPYSEALLLTEIEGLTQAVVAGRLGLSPSGMKSRVQRGRKKLKQALLQCCAIEVDRRGGVIDYRPRNKGEDNC